MLNNVTDDNLEDEVINILGKIDVKVRRRDIKACHRLPPTRKNPNKRVIIRFVNRKNTEKCLENKKKLENIEMSDLNYPNETRLFISENFNAHYRTIGWNCRRLKRAYLISKFKYQNEAFYIYPENSDIKCKILHYDDFLHYFPDFFADEF